MADRIRFAQSAVLGFVVVLLACASTAAADQVPSPWTWNDRAPKLVDVSCSAPGKCVGVGAAGWILRSTAPGQLAWSGVPIPSNQKLVSVSCTAGTPCVTISGGNGTSAAITRPFHSEDGGNTWTEAQTFPAATGLGAKTKAGAAVACDQAGTCVIAGPFGGIWRSTDGGANWEPVDLGTVKLGFTRVACPAAGVCILVGTGSGGALLRGTKLTAISGQLMSGATAIACDKPTQCTAASASGGIASISDPWTSFGPLRPLPAKAKVKQPTKLGSLTCPSADTCVGLIAAPPPIGQVLATSSLTSNAWRRVSTTAGNPLAVGCAGSGCSVVGGGANWIESANSGINWTPVNSVPTLTQLDCPATAPAGTCMGGGSSAIGKTTSGGDFWTTPFPGITSFDDAIASCADYPRCLFVGKAKVLATPDAGTTFNFRFAAGDVTAGPAAGYCDPSSPGRCYGVGSGVVFTTFDGAQSPWQAGPIPTQPMETLTGMACPTPTLCVVSGSESIYRGTLSVQDGRALWSWVATDADAIDGFKGISCSSATSCTAVGGGQPGSGPANPGTAQVATTTDPSLLHWDSQELVNTIQADSVIQLEAVSCAPGGVCVAGGKGGYVASTTDNWATYSLERFPPPVADSEKAPDIEGVRCRSASLCLLLGSKQSPPAPVDGAVYVGSRAG
jgi:photosystem II stability/assembly factor-like uncharacterized protein